MDFTIDVLVKVLIAILGAALGVFLKNYSDKKRLHMLAPSVLRLTKEAALKCTEAFCVADVREIDSLLEIAFRETAEVVKLGINPVNEWSTGIIFIQQTSIKVKRIMSAKDGDEAAIKELNMLREHASKLLGWVEKMN